MKWALAFATARVLAEKIEFLEVPCCNRRYEKNRWNTDDVPGNLSKKGVDVMKKTKTFYYGLVVWAGLLYGQPLSAANDVQTIEKLGGQMSNIRLMLETYARIGMGVTYSDPDAILKKSIAEYEGVLNELEKEYPEDIPIQKSVTRSRTAWKELKEVLLSASAGGDKAVLKKKAQFFHDNIRSIIKEMAADKTHLIQTSGINNADKLNAAIEIGASARRLSAHYMMKLWKLPDPTIKKHWDKGVKIYGDSIALLEGSDYAKDPRFKTLLDGCKQTYRYFIMLFDIPGGMPTLVHKKAEGAYDKAVEMTNIIASRISK